MNSTTQKVHYVSYDKKKSKEKKKPLIAASNTNSNSSNSTVQKPYSTGKLCFRCKAPDTEDHMATCKAQNAKCDECGVVCHYNKACKKLGNFPSKQKSHSTGRMHLVAATPVPEGFYNEQGDLGFRATLGTRECSPDSSTACSFYTEIPGRHPGRI